MIGIWLCGKISTVSDSEHLCPLTSNLAKALTIVRYTDYQSTTVTKTMKIRYATQDDAKILSEIGAETFWDAYHMNSHLEQKFIREHIAKTFTLEQLKEELDREDIIYLIAENKTEKIGYVRLLPENTRVEINANKPTEISRIYLRKKFWGKKLGSTLLEKCFEEAEKQNCDVIWLSVWKYNERAIKFYEKFGFKRVGEHIFDLAGSPQIDLIMEKKLVNS